jgi:hypothetical protein
MHCRRVIGLHPLRFGEKVLLLPPNSAAAKATNITEKSPTATTRTLTNFEQWMLFLFGGSAARLQN